MKAWRASSLIENGGNSRAERVGGAAPEQVWPSSKLPRLPAQLRKLWEPHSKERRRGWQRPLQSHQEWPNKKGNPEGQATLYGVDGRLIEKIRRDVSSDRMYNYLEQSQDSNVADFTALLEKTTVPADIRVIVNGGYQSEDEAQDMWATAMFFFRWFGTVLNLEGLLGVTIDDYMLVHSQGLDVDSRPRKLSRQPAMTSEMALLWLFLSFATVSLKTISSCIRTCSAFLLFPKTR